MNWGDNNNFYFPGLFVDAESKWSAKALLGLQTRWESPGNFFLQRTLTFCRAVVLLGKATPGMLNK